MDVLGAAQAYPWYGAFFGNSTGPRKPHLLRVCGRRAVRRPAAWRGIWLPVVNYLKFPSTLACCRAWWRGTTRRRNSAALTQQRIFCSSGSTRPRSRRCVRQLAAGSHTGAPDPQRSAPQLCATRPLLACAAPAGLPPRRRRALLPEARGHDQELGPAQADDGSAGGGVHAVQAGRAARDRVRERARRARHDGALPRRAVGARARLRQVGDGVADGRVCAGGRDAGPRRLHRGRVSDGQGAWPEACCCCCSCC